MIYFCLKYTFTFNLRLYRYIINSAAGVNPVTIARSYCELLEQIGLRRRPFWQVHKTVGKYGDWDEGEAPLSLKSLKSFICG